MTGILQKKSLSCRHHFLLKVQKNAILGSLLLRSGYNSDKLHFLMLIYSILPVFLAEFSVFHHPDSVKYIDSAVVVGDD